MLTDGLKHRLLPPPLRPTRKLSRSLTAEDLAFPASPMPEAEDAERNKEQRQKQDVAAADDEHDDPDRKADGN
jgi:hypothetical protein